MSFHKYSVSVQRRVVPCTLTLVTIVAKDEKGRSNEKTGKMEKTAAEDAVKLLKDILEIPSVNGKNDEGAVAEYLDQYFKSYGIESRVDRIDETHAM
mgnify:CR=1 FL=1